MKEGALEKKEKEDRTSSRRISHGEAFLVATLLSTAQSEIRLTPETSIAGRTLRDHGFLGPVALFRELKPRDAVEHVLAGLITHTAIAAHDCFKEVLKNSQDLDLVRVNARYAAKFAKVCTALVATFEASQAQQLELSAPESVRIDIQGHTQEEVWNCGSVRQYCELAPTTAAEAIQVSLLLSAINAASQAFDQAKKYKSSRPARETYLNHALMCVNMAGDCLEAFRRSREKAAPKGNKKQRQKQFKKPTMASVIKASKANGHAAKAGTRTNGRHP